MKILLVNNDGVGFADHKNFDDGTTVSKLFTLEMGEDRNPGDYMIRVNREQTTSDRVLVDGDRVTITPTNIEGA